MLITALIVGCSTYGEEKIAHFIINNEINPENNTLSKFLKSYIQDKEEKEISVSQPQVSEKSTIDLETAGANFVNDEEVSSSSTRDVKGREIIEEITNINGNHISIGDKYKSVIESLGNPDEKFGDGGEVYLSYGEAEIHIAAIPNSSGDNYEDLLVEINRSDILHTTREVFSTLGEPDIVEYDEWFDLNTLQYLIDDYKLTVYEAEDASIESVSLSAIE